MKNFKKNAFSLIELSIVILIIGILVAGVTQSSRLVRQFTLNSARNITQGSPVYSIPGLLTWVETTMASSYDFEPEDNSAIAKINDLDFVPSSRLNFIQNTAVKQPLYKVGSFNGLPSLMFDGVDDELITDQSLTVAQFSPRNTNTIFMVIRIFSGVVFFKYERNYDAVPRVGLEINNGLLRFDYPEGAGMLVGPTNVLGKPMVITAHADKINQTLFVNGATYATVANNRNFNYNHSAIISLGSNNGSLFVRCDVAELILFERSLNTEERKSVEQYLGRKWKIPMS
jgi:prepilin-type N-terminal cleavage/methylation domain-containing protein